MSDSNTDIHFEASSSYLIKGIVEDLFSYNPLRRDRVLEYYFFADASLTSPVMSTNGVENIRYVYTVWQVLNRQQPTITNIIFDGNTAVVHLIQNISPRIFPAFIKLQVPSITELHFQTSEADTETLKIYKQEDSWTLEGLIQSMPLISFWYNQVLRVVMGKLVTTTGDVLNAAFQHVQKITLHGKEIQFLGQNFATENMERLDIYRSNLHENYLKGVQEWQDTYIDNNNNNNNRHHRYQPLEIRGKMLEPFATLSE